MGLFRTAARASVATRVVGNTRRRQEKGWAAEDAAVTQAAPAAGAEMEARFAQLKQLGELRDSGVLTEVEFAAEKRKVLGA